MAYTENYCQNGGSNLNAGSTTNNTAAYTSVSGNWVNTTRVFTPTDGSTPASTVNVGDMASVYIDGATVGVYVGRITVVVAGVNGAITVPGANAAGSAPANQTATATIKVGGAFLGPNAASGFPLTLTNWGNNQNTSSHVVRLNMKNDQTYTMTAGISPATGGAKNVVQGYTSSPNDGGKATWDGTTSTAAILSASGSSGTIWADMVFKTAFASAAATLVTPGSIATWIRCIFTGARGAAIAAASGQTFIECEAYDNNKSNTAGLAGFNLSASSATRCVSHDNTGSNTAGFVVSAGPSVLDNCISDTNGGIGVALSGSSNGAVQIKNCDIYNNGSDGINLASGHINAVWIENCNLIKNTGAGINVVSTVNAGGFVYNCGYGAGTQANGSADTLGNLQQSGTITYGSNLTPWVDPANGDFRINLVTANFAGRQAFQQTLGYSSPNTVGYPDIGAAQSLTGGGGTFSKESSYGFA